MDLINEPNRRNLELIRRERTSKRYKERGVGERDRNRETGTLRAAKRAKKYIEEEKTNAAKAKRGVNLKSEIGTLKLD